MRFLLSIYAREERITFFKEGITFLRSVVVVVVVVVVVGTSVFFHNLS